MSDRPRLEHALAMSRFRATVKRGLDGSRVADAVTAVPGRSVALVRSWLAGSALRDVGRAIGHRLETIVRGALVVATIAALGRWVRSSWLYRWLTADPEPDVIVIDLRETVTVRPALVAIDEAIGLLVLGRRTSIVAVTATVASRRVRDAPIRLASIALLLAVVASTAVGLIRGMEATGLWVRAIVAALAVAGTRVELSWETIRESRPARIAIALLEPPEPPERIDGDERERFRDDREE